MHSTDQGGVNAADQSGKGTDAILTARRAAMAVLSRADSDDLRDLWQVWANKPDFEVLRGPETGLVMLRGRIGGGGASFNVGEATVTRATVRLEDGTIGHSYALGRDQEKARLAALFDALWFNEGNRDAVQSQVLDVLTKKHDAADAKARNQAAATKVDFFTMVRGDN